MRKQLMGKLIALSWLNQNGLQTRFSSIFQSWHAVSVGRDKNNSLHSSICRICGHV